MEGNDEPTSIHLCLLTRRLLRRLRAKWTVRASVCWYPSRARQDSGDGNGICLAAIRPM